MAWPKDNQDALIAFYGHPGADVERQMVAVAPPFLMYYEGTPVHAIKFHSKAAPALARALQHVWDYYGHDQKEIDRLRISSYSGAYNPRYIRGSTTKWSNHAYAAAIDLDAAHNAFNTGHGSIPMPVVAAFKAEGARWGGDYQHRTDPMHFEFCDGGEPARTFEQWLEFYHQPVSAAARPSAQIGAPPPQTPVPALAILRKGAKGAAVGALQRALLASGAAIKVDGDYGPATEAAVKSYQVAHGLVASGAADQHTLAALKISGA